MLSKPKRATSSSSRLSPFTEVRPALRAIRARSSSACSRAFTAAGEAALVRSLLLQNINTGVARFTTSWCTKTSCRSVASRRALVLNAVASITNTTHRARGMCFASSGVRTRGWPGTSTQRTGVSARVPLEKCADGANTASFVCIDGTQP